MGFNYIEGKQYDFGNQKQFFLVRFNSVGSNPRLVAATFMHSNGSSGIAYGGFAKSKDFDFDSACRLALSNARAKANA